MARTPPTTAKRDANLTALKAAVMQWYATESVRLDSETNFLKTIVGSRGIVSQGSRNVGVLATLTAISINDFIEAD
jgi:hypothetical protein